jgi:uncharacterized membrane protein YphA (DoxX/SURF4 family)
MKALTTFSRLFVGILFIFSGLIKLNDPLGFSFKLEEYFAPDVLNVPFLIPLALAFALFVVIFEVILGVALLLGYRTKLTLWLLLLLIIFFTFLTFYSAYFNKVTDCGCFGDAIPLKPWGSFTKDIVFLVFILILFAGQKYIKPLFSEKVQLGLLALSVALCGFMGYWVLNHLPLKDFRAYAEGKSIVDGMKPAEELGKQPPVYENIYVMEKADGSERIEITSTQYMDEKWWEKTEWKMLEDLSRSQKIKDGYEPPVHDFSITTTFGDITDSVLTADNYLLFISYKLSKANKQGFEKLAKIGWELENCGIPMLALTSSSADETEAFRHDIQAPFEFGAMDETTLKTIIRANPGVVWLKKGVVFKQWHYNDVPDAEALKALR